MITHKIKSIGKTIQYDGAVEEKDLEGINLSELTDEELNDLYLISVGYAETLIEFEMESRCSHD